MNPTLVKHLARIAVVTAAAAGVKAVQSLPSAEAACKSCVSGTCYNVDGGANSCTEYSSGNCTVGGNICNPELE
jgi:hypothetical protein